MLALEHVCSELADIKMVSGSCEDHVSAMCRVCEVPSGRGNLLGNGVLFQIISVY